MFQDTNLSSVLTPAMVLLVVTYLILLSTIGQKVAPEKRASFKLKMMVFASGSMMLLLLLCLPSTPSLGTFGYPKTVQEIETPEQVLRYLQRYNQALVRTTEVLHWFIFIFVFWFLGSLLTFSKFLVLNSPNGEKS